MEKIKASIQAFRDSVLETQPEILGKLIEMSLDFLNCHGGNKGGKVSWLADRNSTNHANHGHRNTSMHASQCCQPPCQDLS